MLYKLCFVDYFYPEEFLRVAPKAIDISLDDYVGEYIPLRSNQSTFERLGSLIAGFNISAREGDLSLAGRSLWVPVKKDEFDEILGMSEEN